MEKKQVQSKFDTLKLQRYLHKIKSNAIRLRGTYSLPSRLVYYITQLDISSPDIWITYLMNECEMCMRVSGFYNKYKQEEYRMNERHLCAYTRYRSLGYFNE